MLIIDSNVVPKNTFYRRLLDWILETYVSYRNKEKNMPYFLRAHLKRITLPKIKYFYFKRKFQCFLSHDVFWINVVGTLGIDGIFAMVLPTKPIIFCHTEGTFVADILLARSNGPCLVVKFQPHGDKVDTLVNYKRQTDVTRYSENKFY